MSGSSLAARQRLRRGASAPPIRRVAARPGRVMTLSTAMTAATSRALARHLLRSDGQEDLCFALYRPGSGLERQTALVERLVLPSDGERLVHGNVAFTAEYFLRALQVAEDAGAGLALAHSHPSGRGWQVMSRDDIDAEHGHAAQAWAVTGRPLVGLTIASDRSWSARSWARVSRGLYERRDHETVRVVGEKLDVTFNPRLAPMPVADERMVRTVSAWGEQAQADLARLHVAVVGLGSVGMLVAESLVRTGVRRITLTDFDSVKLHNLDRLAHATRQDALDERAKVDVARSALLNWLLSKGSRSARCRTAWWNATACTQYSTAMSPSPVSTAHGHDKYSTTPHLPTSSPLSTAASSSRPPGG